MNKILLYLKPKQSQIVNTEDINDPEFVTVSQHITHSMYNRCLYLYL